MVHLTDPIKITSKLECDMYNCSSEQQWCLSI